MDNYKATEVAYKNGYIDGVNALLCKIQAYYNTLGGKTVGNLVAYTAEMQAKTLVESILGGEMMQIHEIEVKEVK